MSVPVYASQYSQTNDLKDDLENGIIMLGLAYGKIKNAFSSLLLNLN